MNRPALARTTSGQRDVTLEPLDLEGGTALQQVVFVHAPGAQTAKAGGSAAKFRLGLQVAMPNCFTADIPKFSFSIRFSIGIT